MWILNILVSNDMNDPKTLSENRLLAWYDYLNEIFGVLCFTAALSALQFESYSAEVASLSLLFIIVLGVSLSSKNEVKKHQERVERYIGCYKITMLALFKTPVFVIGMVMLVGVAAGLDLSIIKGVSLKSILFEM